MLPTMKTLVINKKCPKGGKVPFLDEDGKVHAGRLARYIATAIELGYEKLKFLDTEINLTLSKDGNS